MSAPAMSPFTTTIQVRFGHVDPAGIAYYPRIFDYVHEVYEELWEHHVGVRYYKMLLDDRIGFPLVHSEVDFLAPLRFGDRSEVSVTCTHLGRSSIGLRYVFRLRGEVCVDARMTTVCTDLKSMKSIELPAAFRAKFEAIREAV